MLTFPGVDPSYARVVYRILMESKMDDVTFFCPSRAHSMHAFDCMPQRFFECCLGIRVPQSQNPLLLLIFGRKRGRTDLGPHSVPCLPLPSFSQPFRPRSDLTEFRSVLSEMCGICTLNSRWIGEPVDSAEECIGPKNKKITRSPSRLSHRCDAVSDANFYPLRLAS